MIITNHQRVAGQHLNNIFIYTPFFFDGELVGFAAIARALGRRRRHVSTGFGAATLVPDPWMEGLQLDQIKICEGGVADEKVLRIIRDNIRFPEASMGDLRSQIAACRLAERRLTELLRPLRRATWSRPRSSAIFDQTETRCRRAVARDARRRLRGRVASSTATRVEHDEPIRDQGARSRSPAAT